MKYLNIFAVLMLAVILSMGSVSAYGTSFQVLKPNYGNNVPAGNVYDYSQTTTIINFGSHNTNVVGQQRQTVLPGSSEQASIGVQVPTQSGCDEVDCDQPTSVTPVVSTPAVSGDTCEMIPYNTNDVNDKTTFWYVVGCFIDIPAFTIDDSITKVVIPSKDSLMTFDGQSVNGMTFSADVGQWLFGQWQGPLITTGDNTLYAFAVANNGGRCIECFEVQFSSGALRFVSLGWIGLGTAPESNTVPLKANRVRHESAYMIH